MAGRQVTKLLWNRGNRLTNELDRINRFVHEKKLLGQLSEKEADMVGEQFSRIVFDNGGLEHLRCDDITMSLVAHGLNAMKEALLQLNPDWRSELTPSTSGQPLDGDRHGHRRI